MTETVCGECGNTWNPDAANFRKYHSKCPICGSRNRADVDIGVETISKSGETGITGDITLSEGANISLTQLLKNIEIAVTGLQGTKRISISGDAFGRPNVNPPSIVDQDNLTLYAFTLNTDRMTLKFPLPYDYVSGDITIFVIWTNDGGVDDNAKFVKWQLDYQLGKAGQVISGSHANSPKTIEDEYTSASGWVEHRANAMTIAEADLAGYVAGHSHIYFKLSAITPVGAALTSEPHFLCVCIEYLAKSTY